VLDQEAYPTGTSDFSSALMESPGQGAQVIMPIFDMAQSGIWSNSGNHERTPPDGGFHLPRWQATGCLENLRRQDRRAINCVLRDRACALPATKLPKSVSFFKQIQELSAGNCRPATAPAPRL